MNMSTASKKGKVLSAQTRAVVFSVLQFALREKKAKTPLLDINKAMDRVAAMTGICRDTLSKIKKEGSTNGGLWETKVKKKRQKVITNPNEVDKINIINKIEEFDKRNEAVSLRKLLKELKRNDNFSGGKTSLLIVLNSMGYKWEKNESNNKVFKKVLPENSDISHIVKTKSFVESCPTGKNATLIYSNKKKVAHTMHPLSDPTPTQEPMCPQVAEPLGPYVQRPLLLHHPHCF